jgi:deoxyribose-phosphate aldolase
MLDAGANRIGTSASVEIVRELGAASDDRSNGNL